MSASRTSLLVVLAFAGGTLLGWRATGDREAPSADAAAPVPTKIRRNDATRALPPSARKLLEPVRAARTDDERMRATLALAASIPLAELEQWLASGWFGQRESMESIVFERILLERWLEGDPAGLIGYLEKTEHPETSGLARRWARHDPAGSFAFFRASQTPDDLKVIAWAADDVWVEKIPEVLAEAMPWLVAATDDFYGSSLINRIAEAHPELISSRMGGWPEPLRKVAATALDRVELEKDFPATLAAFMGEAGGKARLMRALDGRTGLIEKLLDHESQLPPGWFAEVVSGTSYFLTVANPARWLGVDLVGMGLSEEEVRRFRHGAIHSLGRDEPEEALKLLEQGSLSENERQLLVASSFRSLCAEDPARAEALLGQLIQPAEIELARAQIEESRAESKQLHAKSIPEWIASFAHGTEHAEESAAAIWDSRQTMEATAAFDALPSAEKQKIAVNLLEEAGSDIPSELAAAAHSYLLDHPLEGDDDFPEATNTGISDLANEWASRDPLAASRWVASLPEGSARLWAAKNLAARWAEYEPAAARRWVSLLPAGERSQVVDYLDSGAAWKEPEPDPEE